MNHTTDKLSVVIEYFFIWKFIIFRIELKGIVTSWLASCGPIFFKLWYSLSNIIQFNGLNLLWETNFSILIQFIKKNVTVREDNDGGEWVGIWRLILLKHPPYDEPRRNGKVPKILTHRLFPQAQYSIWIDGKMELIVDPLLLLER